MLDHAIKILFMLFNCSSAQIFVALVELNLLFLRFSFLVFFLFS